MVVDSLARSAGIDMRKLEKSAAVGRGELQGRKVILAKPVTFMNNSGESVAALARFYKVRLAPGCSTAGGLVFTAAAALLCYG
jgi:PTH1 family peptidyl-tRNA hydrolase